MGQYNYGDPTRGEGYEYSTFLPAIRALGHEVLFFDTWGHSPYRNHAELNTALLMKVASDSPDVVLSVQMRYEVWLETWDAIRRSGALTVNWAADDSWRYESFSRHLVRHLDLMVTTYRNALAKYARDGNQNVVLSQWAAAAGPPPLPSDRCAIDISFVGTAHGTRRSVIEKLRRAGLEVMCFGSGWPDGPVPRERLEWIVRNSRISLNFANTPHSSRVRAFEQVPQLKARTFEVPGYGGFLLTQNVRDLDRYFQLDAEIATFDTLDDLIKKARFYLAEPRERDRVARAGHMRIAADHTYERRLADVLHALPRRASSQRSFGVDWAGHGRALERHRTKALHKILARLLSGLAGLVFGARHKDQAAERLLFELSWRIAGDKTYSAQGWPGRLYFHG
jgi:spore maturation protein CgeB